ncbi:MAG: FtsX-like permease family protein [Minicystis sp.]
MGYPVDVALRYLGSKKRAFISVGTAFAILGVTLGVAALATVMSVTGGFQAQFREKVLGVNAHVLVLKYSTDFREYRSIMDQVSKVPGVVGTAPFSINPMMLTHGDATATGVLLKGVDPVLSLGVGAPPGTKPVLVVPQQIVGCEPSETRSKEASLACAVEKLQGLRAPGAKPPERKLLDDRPKLGLDDVEPPDAGADEYDDAGRNVNLIRKLEDDIKRREDEARKREQDAEKNAGQRDAGATADPGSKIDDLLDAGAPAVQGEIVPDGGYKSVLPSDDDLLPPEVDPDPCTDPAKIKKMPGVVVGVSLAKTLHLEIGDCVTVTSPTIGYSFSGGSLKPPVARRFRVIALFQAGFDQYDSKLVYTDLFEAQTFYDQGDTVTGVEMIVDDIDKAPKISRQIAEMLGNGLYHTMDWEELNHGLFTALKIQQIGMSAVLALIILVAAFTVVATLIMVVLDKTKEIAVMKAMGATDQAILRIFLYQGAIIGFLGTAFGLLLGLAVCKGLLVYGFPLDPKVYFISRLPVQVRLQEFLITGEIALAICIEATVLPSLYAAGMSPVEGFREQIGSSDGGRRLGRLMTVWLYLVHLAYVFFAIAMLIQIQTNADLPRLVRMAFGGGALLAIFGAVSALALLGWKKWGFYGLCLLHALTAAPVLIFVGGAPAFIGLLPSTTLLALTYAGLRRNWRYLD